MKSSGVINQAASNAKGYPQKYDNIILRSLQLEMRMKTAVMAIITHNIVSTLMPSMNANSSSSLNLAIGLCNACIFLWTQKQLTMFLQKG